MTTARLHSGKAGPTSLVGTGYKPKDVTNESLSVPRDEYANHAAVIDYPPRFVVQSLVLLKYSLVQWKGNRPEGGFFLTHGFAREAADILAGRLMRLNSDDLEQWQADPEEWAVGEEQENTSSTFGPQQNAH